MDMLRNLLGCVLLLGALAGCTERMGECQSDGDCKSYGEQAVCEPTAKFCLLNVPPPEVDGGACTAQCAEYQACTGDSCQARFSGLSVTTPTSGAVFDGGTQTVTVTARLEKVPTYASTTQFPSTLTLSAALPDGGSPVELSPVTANGDGTYTAQWMLPAAESDYVVTAAYPAAGGPEGSVSVKVDNRAPVFSVTVPTPPSPAAADGFAYVDPSGAAFRRDETVQVTVESTATDVDPGSFAVEVRGTDSVDITDLPLSDCVGSTAPFCKVVSVQLWRPAFNAFRGTMRLRVRGKDTVGNPVEASRDIPVTRWRWAFDGAAGDIRASPAVGERGVVYVGTSDVSAGKVFALTQQGTKQWEAALGAVGGSVAVGRSRSNSEELVYLGVKDSTGARYYALLGGNGNQLVKCPSDTAGFGTAAVDGALALAALDVGIGVYETAASVYNSTATSARIVVLRPDELLAADRCTSIVNNTGNTANNIPLVSGAGASVVRSGDNIFYGSTTGRLTSYALGTNTPRSGFPVNATHPPRGLALVDASIYGASGTTNPDTGGVFSLPQAGGVTDVTYLYPSASSATSLVSNLIVGSGNFAFFGAETGTSSSLVRLELANPATRSSVNDPGILRAAPVLGRGGLLYSVTNEGVVGSWEAATLAPRWQTPSTLGAAEASPTLDCMRDNAGAQVTGSTVGMLYVAAGTRLHALIVDSPALEAAPWPKYQHDARNSGNPATPITSCQ